MKDIEIEIGNKIKDLYNCNDLDIQFQNTRRDFEGDITLVVFPLLRFSNKNPMETANDIGVFLKKKLAYINEFNSINGFLNIVFTKDLWYNKFINLYNIDNYGISNPSSNKGPLYILEYSSPNTNKPLHLGHIRNNLLGYSLSQIIRASGKNVYKVQIINDRGIHICKSMVAWKRYGDGEEPNNIEIKGDHLVGKYYVEFDKRYKIEVENLVSSGMSIDIAEKEAPIFKEAQEMLKKWENQDVETLRLWKKMNNWVYSGFERTYQRLGVSFDKNYFESETYLLGKDVIDKGLRKGVFYKKKDGSVWIDLSEEGLDHKLILRSDGTSVYMTQDIGTAIQRYKDFSFSNMIYTVGNEQDYHFKVLFLILNKLGYEWANNCYHLSYGMVDLPSGKMKSREGTVVDADDLMDQVVFKAKEIAHDLGKLDEINHEEANILYEIVGLGALKYYILKVDPQKRMLFNADESIDFNGNTGPFIQYTYVRIQSLFRKYNQQVKLPSNIDVSAKEVEIIKLLLEFPTIVKESADKYSPAIVANYAYSLVKEYNNYYQNISILNAENLELVNFRLCLSLKTGEIIKNAMALLGVDVPERM